MVWLSDFVQKVSFANAACGEKSGELASSPAIALRRSGVNEIIIFRPTPIRIRRLEYDPVITSA